MRFPKNVDIIETCPRDGFQNVKARISTETKVEIIDKLIDCGFRWIDTTSFVHPKAIPQMADAADVMKYVRAKHGEKVNIIALAPNLYGAQRAIEAGAGTITFVISASERHNLENTRQTIKQSVSALKEVCSIKGDRKVRLGVATALDCPFNGAVDPERVVKIIEMGLEAGADEILLADTMGTATPLQMDALLGKVLLLYPKVSFTLHIHDTHGMGLANVLIALNYGVTRYESATFGLGGCPFAPGAAGNIATEDLVNMLHKMGVITGLNQEKIISVAKYIGETLGISSVGHLSRIAFCQG